MGSSAPLQFSDNSSHLVFWHQVFDPTMMYLNRFDPQPTYKWIISATLLLSMVTILVIETSVPRDRRRLPVAKYTPSSFEHAKLRHQNRKAGTIPSQGHNYFGAPTPPSVPCPEPIKSMKEVNEQHAKKKAEKRAKKRAEKLAAASSTASAAYHEYKPQRPQNEGPTLDDHDFERAGFVGCGSAKCPNGYEPVKCKKNHPGMIDQFDDCGNLYKLERVGEDPYYEHYCDHKCFNAENPV